MKYLVTLLLTSIVLFSCSKDKDDDNKNDRTLEVFLFDRISPTSGNHRVAIQLQFLPSVTIQGSVKVDFDIYSLNAFYKHYSEKITFTLNNLNNFLHQTEIPFAPNGMGLEVRNVVVDSLVQTSGNYNITIK